MKSGWYASHWNAFLFSFILLDLSTEYRIPFAPTTFSSEINRVNNVGSLTLLALMDILWCCGSFEQRPLKLFLTPASEVCKGYVFTHVCQSFCSGKEHAWHQGGHAWQRACMVGGMHGRKRGVHCRGHVW